MLPIATSQRWRPIRSGLINLFKFENEEFRFEDGRLLLRGNNGAGKSRVLALQLPFLLDGEISPHRVEPDGDPAKRMEWNLLMGGRHDNRLGYTWIEFGRVDEDGNPVYTTLACGLHARRHGDLKRWFVVTPLRIGEGLHLISGQQLPLTQDRLQAALNGRGQIFTRAGEYRAAVDEALFGLGPRYEPLVELLIRLRQPQLARKLDETVLSNALSDALPPLPANLIDDVAASFRGIEDDREAMSDYRIALGNVGEFLKTYRAYAAIVVRRQAEEVRRENSQYEHRAREIKRYREECQALAVNSKQKRSELAAAETNLASSRATERALRDSPEMKSAEMLALAQEKRDDRRRSRDAAIQQHRQAEGDRAREKSERDAAADVSTQRQREAGEILSKFQEAGSAASFPVGDSPSREALEARFRKRQEAIEHLRKRNAELAEARARRDAAERESERDRSELGAAQEKATQFDEARAAAVEEFARRALAWESTARELKLDGGTDWREAIFAWLEDRQSAFPFELAVREAHREAQTLLIQQRQALTEEQRTLNGGLQMIDEELRELQDGRQPEPTAPHTRAAGVRENRPGAPLWKLCDFREDTPADARAGYEAALEAAGFLDAWIRPDGALVEADTGDVFLTGRPNAAAAAGLNRILRAEPGEVPEAAVRGVLDRIGDQPNEDETWVSSEGGWRNGPLRGDWAKPEAEFIGYTARENARQRRIRKLAIQQDELRESLAKLEAGIQQLLARLQTLDDERNAAPGAEAILNAAANFDTAGQAVADARLRSDESGKRAIAEREKWESCQAIRDKDAADLGLGDWSDSEALADLRDLMTGVRQLATEYWMHTRAASESGAALQRAEARLAEVSERLRQLQQSLAEAERRFTEADAEFETLRATHGETADEVLARLEQTGAVITTFEREVRQLQSDVSKTDGDLRVKEREIELAEEQREERQQRRDDAVERLRSLVRHDFVGEADPDLRPPDAAWSVAKAVELARRAEQLLHEADAEDAALSRAQTNLQTQLALLNDQLGMRGYHPRAEAIEHGVFLVKCPFQGQDRTMTALSGLLEEEVQHRSRMLDEQEREVIENHLIGEVATALQERIREGEDWVRDVNAELEKRPTSSGIKLKFVWRADPDGPPGLPEARQQLLRVAATWSPAERKAIGDFLQDRIRAGRAENEGGSWQDHLTRALDYRSWHRFEVERWQDGKWQRLTKRTYGTGSGGEKAMTLTVPQFAAAAAHYRSASEVAPRLILLDEVFVGIDGETRAKLMGLLDTFDLDFVMTSEREWGCYASVPSLAIYQLVSRPEVQAVHVTRWVWNGKERTRDS